MPTLLIHTFNGREYVSVEYDGPHREERLGEFRRIPITDEQAKLTVDELAKLWAEQKAYESATESERAFEREKLAKMASLLERLARIIRETKHEGERENAKALYLKYAGKAFAG